LEYRLLGNLEVVVDGEPVDIGGTQPRTVLAMLLVAGGRVVPAGTIIDALWGESPPDSAAGTLQSYVSRLRRALRPAAGSGAPGGGQAGAAGGPARVLVWEPPGYRLIVPEGALDTARFEALADEGRALLAAGRAEEARGALVAALRLWRGEALLEFSHLDFAWGFAARLEERRLAAVEDRIEADLRLGRHAAVVGELGELVAANPLREQLRHHLALALYRAGRQAEALRVLDDARRTLRDQLGIDPGRPLVELETAILSQDPRLTPEVGDDVATVDPGAGAAATAGDVAAVPAAGAAATMSSTATAAPAAAPSDGDATANVLAEFVGRGIELRTAIAALDEARTAVRIVLVEGEPGIGKTRLIEELAAEADRRSLSVHWGRAHEGQATPAFWPWLPVVRALVARGGPAAEARELVALLEREAAEEAAPVAERTRFRLLEAITALLADAAATTPLVVLLDDLQWADLPSLELLAFVARELHDRPVLLAGTVRELEVGRNDEVVEALAALSRVPATRRITLQGLSHLETAELVQAALRREVPSEVVAAIQQRAEGNPFFATELAHLVEAERDPDRTLGAVSTGGDVPSGVRDVVRRRTALLPEDTVHLLEVAAVIGQDVDLDLLVHASGEEVDAVLDGIEPAVVHRLLSPLEDRPGTFRFAHALVREVIADGVSALRRARIHLRVAEAIEATAAGDDDAAEILAEHLWAAVPIGVGRRAAAALEHAAEVAVRRYAFESAEGMLERAVQLRRAAGRGADVEAELVAISRLLSIQRSRHGYASVAESPHLRRAKDLAEHAGRDDILARLLWTEFAAYDTRCRYDRSDAIAERLHEMGQSSDDPLVQVTGLASLGISRWHQGRITESAELLDEAVRVGATATPPSMTLGLDLEVLLLPHPFSRYLHALIGDAGDPGADEAGLEALADAAPDPYGVSLVEMLSSAAGLMTGRPEWASRAARRGVDADPESTFSFWGRGLQGYLAASMIDLGQVEEGLALLDEAVARYHEAGGRTGTAVYRASKVTGLVEAGRLDEAARALEEAQRELATTRERFTEPLVLEAEARLRLARGDAPKDVTALLDRARTLAEKQGAKAVAARIQSTAQRLGL
jgi:DNA-binding SARP family transcriptional activator